MRKGKKYFKSPTVYFVETIKFALFNIYYFIIMSAIKNWISHTPLYRYPHNITTLKSCQEKSGDN